MKRNEASGWPQIAAIWKDLLAHPLVRLLFQTVKDASTDKIAQWAAALAYYALLSLFPLLLAAAAIAAYFVEPQWAIQKSVDLLREYLPQGSKLIRSTVEEAVQARGPVSLFSVLLLLWSGSRVFGTLRLALNVAFDADETYGFWQRLLLEVGMLLSLGVLFLLSLVLGFGLDLAQRALNWLPVVRGTAFVWLKTAVPTLLLLATFTLTYRFVPRRRPEWKPALAGAVTASLLFLVARRLFLFYLDQFARYSLIYGSLSAVIGLLVWAWLAALIVLFGAELTAHVQMLVVEGRPAHEVEQAHQERAPDRGSAESG